MPAPTINPPLQIRPEGLLGFLELKRGLAPEQLLRDITPSLDLVQWYLDTNGLGVPSPAAIPIAAVGFQGITQLTVPTNEWWYVTWFGALSATLAAGQALLMSCGVIGAQAEITPLGPPSNLGAPGDRVNAYMERPGIFVPPNGGLCLLVERVTAGPVNVDCHARFTRLPF